MRNWGWSCAAGALCLALLAGCGRGQAEVGYAQDGYAEGRLGDTMHTAFFDYTVHEVYLTQKFERYQAIREGFQLLVAEVSIHNTFGERIPMFDSDFQVQWNSDDPDAFEVPITYYTDIVSEEQFPETYELAADETRTGLLVFEVPVGEKDFSLSYLEIYEGGGEGDVFFVYFTAEAAEREAAPV